MLYSMFSNMNSYCKDTCINIQTRFLKKWERIESGPRLCIFSIPMKYISTKFQVLNRNSEISIFEGTFSSTPESLLEPFAVYLVITNILFRKSQISKKCRNCEE